MRLYVGNLSFNTDEPQLEKLFGALGPVESVKLIRDHATGRSRGFGFVEMDDAGGRAACQTLNQSEFDGRRLTVNEAKPQQSRQGGGGGGGRGGGFGRPKRDPRW